MGRAADLLHRRWLLVTLGGALVLFLLIQLVPYRVDNPAVIREPSWDAPETRALAVAACFDCHSNESDPLWFERIAPVSWLITKDVEDGREELNFSEWGTAGQGDKSDEAAEVVREGEMPPGKYTWLGLHGDARLSRDERARLADGLARTIARSGGEPDD